MPSEFVPGFLFLFPSCKVPSNYCPVVDALLGHGVAVTDVSPPGGLACINPNYELTEACIILPPKQSFCSLQPRWWISGPEQSLAHGLQLPWISYPTPSLQSSPLWQLGLRLGIIHSIKLPWLSPPMSEQSLLVVPSMGQSHVLPQIFPKYCESFACHFLQMKAPWMQTQCSIFHL